MPVGLWLWLWLWRGLGVGLTEEALEGGARGQQHGRRRLHLHLDSGGGRHGASADGNPKHELHHRRICSGLSQFYLFVFYLFALCRPGYPYRIVGQNKRTSGRPTGTSQTGD